MRRKRTICLIAAVIMALAMTTVTASAGSAFKSEPKGLKAVCVSGDSAKLTCGAMKGAAGYRFFVSKSKYGKYKLAAESTKRTVTIKKLKAGKTYYFKVRAFKGKDKRSYSAMSKPVKCKIVLKAPTVKTLDKCCCKVSLKVPRQTGATGCKIYRSTKKSGGYKLIKKTTAETFIDTGLKASKNYYYKVSAYRGFYDSPYAKVLTVKTQKSLGDGNAAKYNPAGSGSLVAVPDSAAKLKGRSILFLGSSITYGSASKGVSFADFVRTRNGASVKKLAVSGTTMAGPKDDTSYVSRLTEWKKESSLEPDVFVCQLSLNDSFKSNGIKMGSLPAIDFKSLNKSQLDKLYKNSTTVGGAIGYITAFAYYYWPDCQVVFFTVRNNGHNSQYAKMRTMLYNAQTKYKTYDLSYSVGDGSGCKGRSRIQIIDMWSIKALTSLKGNKFCLYMRDDNHPKKAGYLYQWTPQFEKKLAAWMTPKRPVYTVSWEDEYENVLEKDKAVGYGKAPSYDGETPSRSISEENVQYNCTFLGWKIKDASDGKLYTKADLAKLKVTGDMTFITQFSEWPEYTVTWYSWDGSTGLKTTVKEGMTPSDIGTPDAPGPAYKFTGWATEPYQESGKPAGELPKVKKDVAYYAAFSPVSDDTGAQGGSVDQTGPGEQSDTGAQGETVPGEQSEPSDGGESSEQDGQQ